VIQADVTRKMRAILVDWLVMVCVRFSLKTETFFITVGIIDKFLQKEQVGRLHLQLLGATALMIAGKYEEIYPPLVNDYKFICAGSYTGEQILDMEAKIVKALGFGFSFTTSFNFLQLLLQQPSLKEKIPEAANPGSEFYQLALYCLEIATQEYKISQGYRPLILAASAIYISQKILHDTGVNLREILTANPPNQPSYHAKIRSRDFRLCTQWLYRALKHQANEEGLALLAIKNKYMEEAH
jgi:hypothetical protein